MGKSSGEVYNMIKEISPEEQRKNLKRLVRTLRPIEVEQQKPMTYTISLDGQRIDFSINPLLAANSRIYLECCSQNGFLNLAAPERWFRSIVLRDEESPAPEYWGVYPDDATQSLGAYESQPDKGITKIYLTITDMISAPFRGSIEELEKRLSDPNRPVHLRLQTLQDCARYYLPKRLNQDEIFLQRLERELLCLKILENV